MGTKLLLLDSLLQETSQKQLENMGLNVDQELFEAFGFYAAVVLVKMLFMAFLTARQRFGTGTFISSEDIVGKEKKGFTTAPNENVERVRRAHLNDIENIAPFFCLGLLYIFTSPALATALLVFRIFAACRIAHSIVYLLVIPQVRFFKTTQLLNLHLLSLF